PGARGRHAAAPKLGGGARRARARLVRLLTSRMEVRHFQKFSDLVRAGRKKHRFSQRALAKALQISPGYVGQWELELSQPSEEVTRKLCRLFGITDAEYVQRLAFASRAPDWLRESILSYQRSPRTTAQLGPLEQRLIDAAKK